MRLLDINELRAIKGIALSRRGIWNKVKVGTFPQPRKLGLRAVWIEAEIDAWIAALPAFDGNEAQSKRASSAALKRALEQFAGAAT